MSILTELQKRRKDNRLIVGLALAVLVAWVGVSVLEQRAAEMESETITRGILLFVLSYINVTLIAAVLFVLFRTLIKLWLERRRGAMGSRFKTRLLVTYVVLTAIPIGLVFVTATGLLQRSIDRWFSTPVREVVNKARAVEDLAERRIEKEARDNARALSRAAAARGGALTAAALEDFRSAEGLDFAEVYAGGVRVAQAPAAADLPGLPPDVLDRTASGDEATKVEVLADGSHRVRSARRDGGSVYVAGILVPPSEARAMTSIAQSWSDYQKLEVQKPSIKAANIGTFLLITLAVLLAAIWTGLTLARRITEPIAALAESTRQIRSGNLTARVAVPSTDELGALVDSFNDMAAGLERARNALLRSNEDLLASYERLDLERRLVATVLESVTTGVVAFDADGEVTLCNPAARTLLGVPEAVTAEDLRARPDLAPLVALLDGARAGAQAPTARELHVAGDGGDSRLEVSVRPLSSAPGDIGGWVLAIEDTTHVAREQKLAAWSEIARRVAHEIKNPLTPIRLSAERIARRSRSGEPDLPQAIERGTRVIVEEVDALKSLVDEFSRFARLPQMRLEPTDLVAVARSAASLFEGARTGVRVTVESRLSNPIARVDPEQIKRALVNLIDNALEACGESGTIAVLLSDRGGGVNLEVADTGRGVPADDRERLFLPDFTTKGRGTGLGLAIVSRIVSDHNGTIRIEDNQPRGARFIIELPAA